MWPQCSPVHVTVGVVRGGAAHRARLRLATERRVLARQGARRDAASIPAGTWVVDLHRLQQLLRHGRVRAPSRRRGSARRSAAGRPARPPGRRRPRSGTGIARAARAAGLRRGAVVSARCCASTNGSAAAAPAARPGARSTSSASRSAVTRRRPAGRPRSGGARPPGWSRPASATRSLTTMLAAGLPEYCSVARAAQRWSQPSSAMVG